MKVCIIGPAVFPVPPATYGGIETILYDLVCELVKLGHETTLVARPKSKSPGKLFTTFPDTPSELGVEERHFKAYRDFVSNFDGVVHDHTNGKMAHKIHQHVLNTMHWCQHPSAAGYKNVSAVSHAHARWLEQYMPAGRVVEVVHHGIRAERFIYGEEKEDYYLFFSVIGAYKGIFDALKLADETGAKFVFAGKEGEATPVLKWVTEELWYFSRPLMRNVTYKGEVSNEKRAKLMSKAKALVFPTGSFGKSNWLEVFGFVQLEALASGTPVIASSNGACPEIIEHGKTGFICESYEEMKRVVEEGMVEDINPKTCREVAEGKFSARTMAENYVKLYKKVFGGW